MKHQSERPGLSRITVIVVTVLLLILAVVVVVRQFWPPEADFVDEAGIAELREANLNQKDAPVQAGDWPQWRGPNRDGISHETGLLTEWPTEETLRRRQLWERPTGQGFSSVAVANGRAYTMFQDGEREVVACWDAATGQPLWDYRYVARFVDAERIGPAATPTVVGDRIYTVGGTGVLLCLKAQPATASGEVVWRKDLLDEFQAQNLRWGVSFSPLVVGDLVYTNPGGPGGNSLAALNRHTGEVVWHNLDDEAGYSSPIVAKLAGQDQIVFFTTTGLVGVTPRDGKLLWRFSWGNNVRVNAATPIAAGDYVFVSSSYGKGNAVVKIEDRGGELTPRLVYRNRLLKNHFASSVLYKDHLYGFNDSLLTCMEFRTGKVCWTLDKGREAFGKGSLIIADGHLILLGDTGLLAVAEATPRAIELKGQVKLFEPKRREYCWSLPVVANGRLYVRDEHRLICFDLRRVAR
jgi:outer membrane protein assembly factor BamB